MNIRVLCVGKLKERYFVDACAEYEKRLSRYHTLSVTEVADERAPETLSPAEETRVKEREGGRLLRLTGAKDYVIALTPGGTELTSPAFAAHLTALADGGVHDAVFLIGGSLGLSQEALSRANGTLSLGKMTLPHRIARLVLLEQLYRAAKISAGEPYHK